LIPAIAHAEENKTIQNSTATPKVGSVSKATQAKGWVKQQGKWYYYKNGKKVTGWSSIGGKWYYFSSYGIMQTGWVSIQDKKTGKYTYYYLNESTGAMHTGWTKVNGTWYFFNNNG
ncbi:N-acetylmuramoyl-L-alanine amidase family protein, partial [Bacillus pseudomycoides]|nr:N-acetylmuramoyl-L-alanine amidase family protein [Bacillus pseudomycoides]